MSLPRTILLGSVALFGLIAVVGVVKKTSNTTAKKNTAPLQKTQVLSVKASPTPPKTVPAPVSATQTSPLPVKPMAPVIKAEAKDDFPEMDRIHQLFTTGPTKLPIVETVSYSSSVPWLKGRPAWVADYASHYQTSRHFIARSLNGKSDYFSQKIATGNRFNVFRADKRVEFYLLIDVSRLKMGFYYVDLDTQERVLLKTYKVGLGRTNPGAASGCTTPLGKYSLGSKIAIYKPGITGFLQDQKVEMIRIFGTRWIPFDQELENTSAPAKGYGIHGAPWKEDPKTGQLVENRNCIGTNDSDGCIRLQSEDMEELFSIVITKPTYVVIVKDFHEAMLPGTEVVSPKRKE